jgi:hypothetical protein
MKTLELYCSRNKLHVYDELKMNYAIFWMKQKVMKLKEIEVDKWWSLLHDMVIEDLENIFAKHYVNEEIHLKKIKAYKQVY